MTEIGIHLFIVLATFAFGNVVSTGAPWEKDIRLPKDIHPISYDVLLHPNLEEGNFKGHVKILVNISSPRDWLPIHIKMLNISETRISTSSGKDIKIQEAFKYQKSEFWVMKTEKLQPGTYILNMKFKGSLIHSIVGFYRSVYYENGQYR